MTAKSLTVIALVAFVLTTWSQTNNTDAHGADASPSATNAVTANVGTINGRTLFLRNCAHCHGANAHGDEGPDLHNLDWTDDQIITRIRNGKKGQMTAFAGKLSADQINEIKDYVRTLK